MTAIVRLEDVHVEYGGRGRRGRRQEPIRALDGVTLDIEEGVALGIVGESGSGKSTLARTVMGLIEPTAGTVHVGAGETVRPGSTAAARLVQMVFQDPVSSLNPTLTVESMLSELLAVHQLRPRGELRGRCEELLAMVSMPPRYLDARPAEMSGGQRQRIAIARALALEPTILVADEPVSALDLSVQAAILNLLADLRRDLGMTQIYISHDISTVRYLCDEVVVMYLGQVVERGPVDRVLAEPEHDYTRELLAAVPRLGEYG